MFYLPFLVLGMRCDCILKWLRVIETQRENDRRRQMDDICTSGKNNYALHESVRTHQRFSRITLFFRICFDYRIAATLKWCQSIACDETKKIHCVLSDSLFSHFGATRYHGNHQCRTHHRPHILHSNVPLSLNITFLACSMFRYVPYNDIFLIFIRHLSSSSSRSRSYTN